MKLKFESNRGITLIALVITIIVLLILAGISISMLAGDNSILYKSGEAKEETRGSTVKEYIDMWKYNNEIDKYSETKTSEAVTSLLDSLENQNLLINDERSKLEAGDTIKIGSSNISLGEIALSDIEKLKKYFISNNSDIWWDDDEDNWANIYPILDASTSINYIKDRYIDGISEYSYCWYIKYNNNIYQLSMRNDQDNTIISVEEAPYYIYYTGDGIYLKSVETDEYTTFFEAYEILNGNKNNINEYIIQNSDNSYINFYSSNFFDGNTHQIEIIKDEKEYNITFGAGYD